ncbi:ATP-binding cassette domain-containing protein [Arcanobacterium hippocoleae]
MIRNANFSLKQGTIGALFGFSGSGKRVLLEIIAGLSKADSGTVFIFGTEMTALLPAQQQKLRREKVSIIFESTNLIEDLRIKQNLELSFMLANKPIDPGEFAKVVTLFGINDLLGNYPEEISLFEERKVALARAVLTKIRCCLFSSQAAILHRKSSKNSFLYCSLPATSMESQFCSLPIFRTQQALPIPCI